MCIRPQHESSAWVCRLHLKQQFTLLFTYLHLFVSLILQLWQIWYFNFNEFAINYPHRHSNCKLQLRKECTLHWNAFPWNASRADHCFLISCRGNHPVDLYEWHIEFISSFLFRFIMMDLKDNITTAVPPPEGKHELRVCRSLRPFLNQKFVSTDLLLLRLLASSRQFKSYNLAVGRPTATI